MATRKVIRILQEDWAPLRNLYRAAKRFTQQSGIEVQVYLSPFPAFWVYLKQTFENDHPPFDIVGCDELILKYYAHRGRVWQLDEPAAKDGYDLNDFQPMALAAAQFNGRLYGLPHVFDPNVLFYRHDLFEAYGVAVPQTFEQVREAAITLQKALRQDGVQDFYGITLRGTPVEAYMECGMSLAASYGVRWFDEAGHPTVDTPAHVEAVAFYVDLLRQAGPPDVAQFGYMDSNACYRSGKAAMEIQQINEAAAHYALGGLVAEGTRVTRVPAGPTGERCAGFYGPPIAIPAHSPAKALAWEFAKFLCGPEQLVHDAQHAAFISSARASVLDNPHYQSSFRSDLTETFRATIPLARPERPRSSYGAIVTTTIGQGYHDALIGAKTPAEAVRSIQANLEGVAASGGQAFLV